EREKAARDFAIAQGQQRDYEARLGAKFAHTGYVEELTGLRNQLEAALSSTAQQAAEDPLLATGAIVTRIKALTAAHTVEVAPERRVKRTAATIEESVTTRIRTRMQEQPLPHPEAAPSAPAVQEPPAPLPAATVPSSPAIGPLFEDTGRALVAPSPRPKAD